MVQLMKDYVDSRGAWIDATILTNESEIPATPTATYTGDAGHPVDALTFQTSVFSSPTGGTESRA